MLTACHVYETCSSDLTFVPSTLFLKTNKFLAADSRLDESIAMMEFRPKMIVKMLVFHIDLNLRS